MFSRIKNIPLVNAWLRRPPVYYANAANILEQTRKMTCQQREAFQYKRLKKILTIARTLPGYSNVLADDQLHNWPILDKSALAGREEKFLPRTWGPESAASTGGTTGQSLRLQRSLAGVAFEQALIDMLCQRVGHPPRTARIAVLRGDSIKNASDQNPPYWIDQGARKRIFSAHHLCSESATHYCEALREFAPDILFCYPSALAKLLHVLSNSPVRIPLILASSEVIGTELALQAAQTFNSKVIDFYGHAERVVAASSCDQENYWFESAYGHIELLPEGDGLASIIATSLWANGQIFIRYRTGDLALVRSQEPEYLREVALGLRPFPGIAGRKNEYIDLPDGRRIIGLNHIPRDVPSATSVQLRVAADNVIDIFVAVDKQQEAAAIAVVQKNLTAKFPDQTRFRYYRTNGALCETNGKAPLLLRNPVIPPHNTPERLHMATMEPVA